MSIEDLRIQGTQPPSDNRISIDDIFLILRRNIKVMLLVVIAIMAAAIAIVMTRVPIYRADAAMVLTVTENRMNPNDVQLESYDTTRAMVETQMDLLRSREFAGAVAKRLDLLDDPGFSGDVVLQADRALDEEQRDQLHNGAVLEKLLSSYTVTRKGESLVIVIEAASQSPFLAARIANGVVQTFMDQSFTEQRDTIAQSIAYLNSRVQALDNELSNAEIRLADFIREKSLDDTELPGRLRTERDHLAAVRDVLPVNEAPNSEYQRVLSELENIEAQLQSRTRADLALLRDERSLELLRQRYQTSIDRLKMLEPQLELVTENARQISYADIPLVAAWPNRPAALALSFVGAVALAFVTVLLVHGLKRTIWDVHGVRMAAGLQNFGYVPRFRKKGLFRRAKALPQLLQAFPRSALNESFRSILTLLTAHGRKRGMRSVMITSSIPLEGKSNITAGLAVSAALEGAKVSMIDLDTRRHGLTRLFGIEPGNTSIHDLLKDGSNPLEAIRHDTGIDNLDMMQLGAMPGWHQELMEDAAQRIFLPLRDHYDLILIDTPPVLLVDDAARLGDIVDCAVMVVRAGVTTESLLSASTERLTRSGVNVAGTVINGVTRGQQPQYVNAATYGGTYGYG